MKQRFFYIVQLMSFGCCVVILSNCRDSDGVRESKELSRESSDDAAAVQKDRLPTELVREALRWAEGKTPEEMATALSQIMFDEDADGEFSGWCQHVTGLAFIDAYGEELATERMQEVFQQAYSEHSPFDVAMPEHYYGALSDYDGLYEIAVRSPKSAFARIEGLMVHPDEKEELKGEALVVYGAEQPERALKLLDSMGGFARQNARSRIVEQWARSDAEAAFDYTQTLVMSDHRAYLEREALNLMVESDPVRALEIVSEMPLSSQSDYTFSLIAKAYIRKNPEAGAEWIMGQEYLDSTMLSVGVESLAKDNPDLAYELMLSADVSQWRTSYIHSVANSMVERDVSATLEWAQSLPLPGYSNIATSIALEKLAENEPGRIGQYLDSMHTSGLPRSLFTSISREFAESHPDLAMQWALTAQDSRASAYVFDRAIAEILEKEPDRVGELLMKIEPGTYRATAIGAVIRGWVRDDLDGAVNWVVANSDRPDADLLVRSVARPWLNEDAGAALQYAASLPVGQARSLILEGYVDLYAESKPSEIVGFIDDLPNKDENYDEFVQEVFREAKYLPTEQAVEMIRDIADPALKEGAVLGQTQKLIRTDIEAAGALLAEFEQQGVYSREATISLMGTWRVNDIEAGVAWIESLSAGEMKNAATKSIVREVAKKDLSKASSLLNGVEPGRQRVGRMIQILGDLSDLDARDAFAASVMLTTDERILLDKRRKKLGR